MPHDLEFLLGLIDQLYPAFASAEDFAGRHGDALRFWQKLGFLSHDPEPHPAPSCPHCREGEPSLLGGQYLCTVCHAVVDSGHLLLWRFDLERLLSWLSSGLKLEGDVRQVDETLWQLGSSHQQGLRCEFFFRRGDQISERGRSRLTSYINGILMGSLPYSVNIEGFTGQTLSLIEILRQKMG